MADDMGYGDPSYVSDFVLKTDGTPHPDQGWIDTPNMDAMAASGLRFNRFYSASAVCSPTRASSLTGRNPFRVGVPYANRGSMGADETPLSEILSAHGYATGHFGKWHLGTMTTLRRDANRGNVGNTSEYSAPWHFDYDVCFATESKVPTYHPYRVTVNGRPLPTAFEIDPEIGYKITDSNFYGTHFWTIPENPETAAEGVVVPLDIVNNATDGDDSKLLTDQAISFIQDSVSEGKPFFVVLWYHTPHKPLVDPDGVSGVDSTDAAKDSIEDMDAQIGALRTALDAEGVRGNTMIWLTSDNGPENGVDSPGEISTGRSIRSGGLRARKRSFYEGGIRVPGILEWPDKIPTGRTTEFVSSTSDYYPTILDYLDISVPDQKALDGISLRPLIEGTLTERPSPIGFLLSAPDDNKAWITQDYKLVKIENNDWELFDMTLPDHQLEITPLATASNVSSQSQAVQDVYNAMFSDYSAWKTTVDSDEVYVDSNTPTVNLSLSVTETEGPLTVTVTFSEAVEGLSAGDFNATGAYISHVEGSDTDYSFKITPNYIEDIAVELPQGAAFSLNGIPSSPSNRVEIEVINKVEAVLTQTTLPMPNGAYATVDSDDLSPANGSNNVDKFPGTSLYVRSSASESARQVKAFLLFDLSSISGDAVNSATLHLRGTSLNDINPVSLQALAAAEDWQTTPSYNIATQGSVVNGPDVSSGLDGALGRDYALDVTDIVNAWLEGTWANQGFVLQLSSPSVNNGIGFELTGEDAPYIALSDGAIKLLRYQVVPKDTEENDVLSLVFQTFPSQDYFLHKSTDLSPNGWTNYTEREASSSLTIFDVAMDEEKAFFRLSEESAP